SALVDVLGDETVGLAVDVPGASGKLLNQLFRHTGDRPRRVPVPAHVTGLPFDTEGAGHVIGEHRLVQLRERDHGGVHRPPIQTPPLPIQDGLYLVGDHDVGVQVGVAGTGVEVIERSGYQPSDIDLRHSSVAGGCAGTGGCNLALHE